MLRISLLILKRQMANSCSMMGYRQGNASPDPRIHHTQPTYTTSSRKYKQTQSKVIQFANGQRGVGLVTPSLPNPTHSSHFLRSFPQSMELQPPKFHHLAKSPLVAPFPRVDIFSKKCKNPAIKPRMDFSAKFTYIPGSNADRQWAHFHGVE